MSSQPTRRSFLAAGLTVPAVAYAASSAPQRAATGQSGLPADSGVRYRVLGRTGMKVSTVGFGCMLTSDGSVIERAADSGINFFDTARSYQGGNNERMVGAALRNRRQQVFISTKTGARSRSGAMEHLETSLRELGTDYIDVWNLHGLGSPSQLTDELAQTLVEAKKQGKARFTGVSLHSGHSELLPFLAQRPEIDVIVVSYNFTMAPAVEEAIAAAAGAGKGIVAMKVMAGGFRRARPGDSTYDKLKQEGAMTAALKWAIRKPFVHTSIPSIVDLEQLEQNFEAMAKPLTPEEQKILAARSEFLRPLYCRMCGACSGSCPKGVEAAEVIRYLTYAEGYGQFALGRESFLQLPAEQRQVRCADCESCAIRCPNGVQVRDRLIRAQELFA